MRQSFKPIWVLLVGMLALVPSANAHQQKEAYSTLLFNPRSGFVEIAHRFSLHDAEHAFAKLTNANIVLNKRTQGEFANYIFEQFQLKDENGELVALRNLGFEVEGKFIWIYQEYPLPDSANRLTIRMTALQEIWPQQINYINVEKEGKTRSLRLAEGDDWQELVLAD